MKKTCKILGIEKTQPIVRSVQGIKKHRQSDYDFNPWLRGSNGTYCYTEVNPYWIIKYRVYGAYSQEGQSYNEVYTTDIHNFIENTLKSHKGWSNMTAGRLESINKMLYGKKVNIFAKDVSEAPIYWDYVPVDFLSWDEYLLNVLIKKIV